jgi:hypothetical protein
VIGDRLIDDRRSAIGIGDRRSAIGRSADRRATIGDRRLGNGSMTRIAHSGHQSPIDRRLLIGRRSPSADRRSPPFLVT